MVRSRIDSLAAVILVVLLSAACGSDEPTTPPAIPEGPIVVDVLDGLVTTSPDTFLAAINALDTDTTQIEQVLMVLRQQVNPLSPERMRALEPAVLLLPFEARGENTRGGIETGTSSYWDPSIQADLAAIVEAHGGTANYVYETLPAVRAILPPDSASRRDLFAELALHANLDWVEPAGPGYFDPVSNPVPLGGVRAVLDPGSPFEYSYPIDAVIRYTLFFDTRDTVFNQVCDFGENGHWRVFLERMEGVWTDVGEYGCAFGFPRKLVLPPGAQFRDSVRLHTAPPPPGKYRFYWGYNYGDKWMVWDSVLSLSFNLQ